MKDHATSVIVSKFDNLGHAGDEAVASAAQQRMLEVCRQVITRAAHDTWQQTTGQHQHDSALHHVTDGTSWEQVRQGLRRQLVLSMGTAAASIMALLREQMHACWSLLVECIY